MKLSLIRLRNAINVKSGLALLIFTCCFLIDVQSQTINMVSGNIPEEGTAYTLFEPHNTGNDIYYDYNSLTKFYVCAWSDPNNPGFFWKVDDGINTPVTGNSFFAGALDDVIRVDICLVQDQITPFDMHAIYGMGPQILYIIIPQAGMQLWATPLILMVMTRETL